VLRALLGKYEHVEPAAMRLDAEEAGKPTLTIPQRDASVSFNLSHSGPLALYAFTEAGAVGVDVQTVPARPIDHAAIAARLLGSREGRRLSELTPTEREREFLRAWARHEATVKCHGSGISGGADARTSDATEGVARARLWVAELDVGAGAAGAVALEQEPLEMRCWSYGATSGASDGAGDGAGDGRVAWRDDAS
jgi:4'-phosphopantetheinyl transferase